MLIQNKKSKLNIKLQYIGLFIIGLVFFSLSNIASASWMDAKWLYRAAVPITAHTAAETNVYTTITIDTATPIAAGKMQADCGDIRVAKFNGATLPYFINASPGCNNVATTIQVYFTSFPAGAQTIYYYYGNPTTYNGFRNFAFATAATGETIGAVGSETQGTGPVGYWKFDDGQGQSTKDGSSQGNNGTLGATSGSSTDDPTWITEDRCISGKCLYFDGTSDYVNVTDNNSLDFGSSNSFTISAWGRTSATAEKALFYKNQYGLGAARKGYALGIYNSKPQAWLGDSANTYDFAGTSIITDNKWHFYTLTVNRSNNTAYLYLDGKQENSLSIVGMGDLTNANALTFGVWVDTDWWSGFIDEPKIYPYARTAVQVKTDYLAGKANATAHSGSSVVMGAKTQDYLSNGLVGYWKMDETSGDAADSSGNSLTLTNNSSMAYGAGKFGNAAQGDGTADYLNTTTTISSVQTIAFWVNPANSTDNYINLTGSTVYINSSSGTVSATGVTSPSIYVNGVLNGTVTASAWNHIAITTASAISASQFEVGRANSAYAVSGSKLDEVRLYNRALSPTEVSNLYNWAPGPVGYWDFDGGSGTSVVDKSGNANTGTWAGTGATHWDAGKYGKAGKFNGSDDYVASVSNVGITGANPFTMEAWINPRIDPPDTPNDYMSFIKWGTASNDGQAIGSILRVSGVNYLGYLGYNDDFYSNLVVPSNTWSHVVITYSGGTYATGLKIYLNGQVNTSLTAVAGATSGTPNVGASVITVGERQDTNSSYFDGKIDDVRIYNYARTQKQIVSDMNGSHPSVGSPVGSAVGYWKFDEGQGTVVNNSGSAGSVINGAWQGSSSHWSNSGKFGKAGIMTANADYTQVADNTALDLAGPFTISAWVNPNNSGNDIQGLVTKDTSYNLWYHNGFAGLQGFSASIGGSGVTKTVSFTDNTSGWKHIVLTFDGTTLKLYKDTVLQSSAAASNPTPNNNAFRIGMEDYGGGDTPADYRGFNGFMDEVKVYNYALTSDEIKTEYNHGSSMQLGALGTNSTYAAGAANQEYCVPGDGASCAAPVGRWDFEEKKGTTTNDTSGNSNTGTLGGDGAGTDIPIWKAGKVGGALSFDGSDDYVDIGSGSTLDMTGAMTIEFWMKRSVNSANRIIDSSDGGWNKGWVVGMDGSFRLFYITAQAGVYQQSFSNASALSLGKWQHVAIVRSGATATFYVDGVNQTESSAVHVDPVAATTNNALIGNGVDGNPFNGFLDQVRIFNYARSAAQVAYDYNRGAPVGWWKMDECQGGTIYDSSGNGNHGTITIGASGTQTGNGTCVDGMSTSTWANGATGKRNSSLNFDGTDDYVNISSTAGLISDTKAMSITAWINTTSTGGVVYGEGNVSVTNPIFQLEIASSKLYAFVRDDAGTYNVVQNLGPNINTGNWVHIAMTVDANGKITGTYVNGQLISTATTNTLSTLTTTNTKIGVLFYGAYPTGLDYFKGQIDDVRVYNYALTATQVKDIYTNGSATFAPSTGTP